MIRLAIVFTFIAFVGGFWVGKTSTQHGREKVIIKVVEKDRAQADEDKNVIATMRARIEELSRELETDRECFSPGDTDRLRSLWTTP